MSDKRMSISMLCLLALLALSAPAQQKREVPAATQAGSADALKWWEALRKAGEAAVKAAAQKDEAIKANGGSGAWASASQYLSGKQLAQLDGEIMFTAERYLAVLREGVINSHRVPLADTRPVILRSVKAGYTPEARQKKIEGVVVLSAEFRADGKMGTTRIVRGLGAGLDEQALAAADQVLFLPAVRDGKFATVRAAMQFSFNLY